MDKLKKIWKKIGSWASMRIIFLVIITLLALFGIFKFCSRIGVPIKSVYTIARDPSWYPLELLGKEKNMLAFSDELISAIAKKEKIRIELLLTGPNVLFEGLDNDEYDGVLAALSPNVVNKEKYLFSEPFYLVGPVLILPQKSQVKSLDEMANKVVGVRSGSSIMYNVIQYPSIIIVTYEDINMA